MFYWTYCMVWIKLDKFANTRHLSPGPVKDIVIVNLTLSTRYVCSVLRMSLHLSPCLKQTWD